MEDYNLAILPHKKYYNLKVNFIIIIIVMGKKGNSKQRKKGFFRTIRIRTN